MARLAIPFEKQMQAAKQLALSRRNRGLHTGASAKGWNYTRPEMPDEWASRVIVARNEHAAVCREALNDYRATCLNNGDDNDIPF